MHLQQSLPKVHVREDGRKGAACLQGILGPFLKEKNIHSTLLTMRIDLYTNNNLPKFLIALVEKIYMAFSCDINFIGKLVFCI